jgi:hypothetical protein
MDAGIAQARSFGASVFQAIGQISVVAAGPCCDGKEKRERAFAPLPPENALAQF